MKSLVAFAALAAVAAIAAPASAQTLPSYLAPISYNAGIGYTGIDLPGKDLGGITLRAGADFGKYFGVEGEATFGTTDVDNHNTVFNSRLHLNQQYAGYGVVRYPVLPNANIFARGGYGHTDLTAGVTPLLTGVETTGKAGLDSWNYGAGAQYFFDGKNGLRAEYTRQDFVSHGVGDADTWSVSYVHKF
ncbi:MAG: porin family protein [Caulobacteraceae bacterium]